VPGEIQVEFLKTFKEFILKFLKRDCKFIIVTGGGSVARNYIAAASKISKIPDEDKDWLGIHATRINAHLLRTIFRKEAYPVVLDNPTKKFDGAKYKLFIASGWRPGWSTDYVSVLLAERFGAQKLINASNITHVYDKNKKNLTRLTWKKYRGLISSEWKPGMNVPFDPVAAKAAQRLKIDVIVADGTDLQNLENILLGEKFEGTVITSP